MERRGAPARVVKALSSRIEKCQPIGIIGLLKDQKERKLGRT
jgi:hypothetical protein